MQPRSPLQRRILDSLRGLPLNDAGRAYLEKRGLVEVATDLGFGVVPDSPAPRLRQYAGRLAIPSIGPDDNVYDVAFRCLEHESCKDHDCRKYLFLPGMPKRLYNLRALDRAADTISITEGQVDAATLEACGMPAVGVAGAEGWKQHHRRLFTGFPRVLVWGDGDPEGRHFAEKVSHDVAGAEVMMVPWGTDVNELYVSGGREAVLAVIEGETDDLEASEHGEWGLDDEGGDPPF